MKIAEKPLAGIRSVEKASTILPTSEPTTDAALGIGSIFPRTKPPLQFNT